MIKRLFVCTLGLAGLFFLSHCSSDPDPPEDLLEEETYIDLIIELQLIKTYRELLPPDSIAGDSLAEKVYEKYGINPEQFQRSHEYYRQDLQAQPERIDRAIEKLKMDQIQDTTSK